MASSTFNKSVKRTRNDDLDSDSDSELYVTSERGKALEQAVSLRGAEEHQEAERRILPCRVFQKSPGGESAENDDFC